MKRLLLLLTLVIPSFLFAKVVYVNTNYTGTVQNGESWATPYTELKQAVDAAEDGDELWFAKGEYNKINSSVDTQILLDKNLKFFGGFLGNESSKILRDYLANKTVITAYNEGVNNTNYYTLFNIDNKGFIRHLEFDGFHFTDLNSLVYQNTPENNSPTSSSYFNVEVRNSEIYDLEGRLFVILSDESELTLDNINFHDNVSTYLSTGGNNSKIYLKNSVIQNNGSNSGSSTVIYQPSGYCEFVNSSFINNQDCSFALFPENLVFDDLIISGNSNQYFFNLGVSENLQISNIEARNNTTEYLIQNMSRSAKNTYINNVTVEDNDFKQGVFQISANDILLDSISMENNKIVIGLNLFGSGQFPRLSISNIELKNNEIQGDLIKLNNNEVIKIENLSIVSNTIDNGNNNEGALINARSTSASIKVNNLRVDNNFLKSGKSVLVSNASIEIEGSNFNNNKFSGGKLINSTKSILLDRVQIKDNTANIGRRKILL